MMPLVPLLCVLASASGAPAPADASAPATVDQRADESTDRTRVWLVVSVELGEQTDEQLSYQIRLDSISSLKRHGWTLHPDATRRVHITVTMADTETHALTYNLIRRGRDPEPVRKSECGRCGSDQVIAKVREDLIAVVAQLDTIAPVAAVEAPSSPGAASHSSNPTKAVDSPRTRPLGRMGRAGVGTLVVGTVAATTGVVLVAVGKVDKVDPGNELRVEGVDYRIPGGIVLGVGAAALITGIALLAVDRRRDRPRRAHTSGWFAPGGAGVSIRVAW